MKPKRELRLKWVRRALLWLALGPRTYAYMCESLRHDKRTPRARLVDIVVRKDAVERRVEADWCRTLARIVGPGKLPDSPVRIPNVFGEP